MFISLNKWELEANRFIKQRNRFGTYRPVQDRFYRIWHDLRQRCLNPNNSSYKNYGKRRIGFLITIDNIIRLWFRDKAYLMKKPSLDRKKNNGHYVYDNCQFIEMIDNIKKSNRDRKFNKPLVDNKLHNK